MHHDANVIGQMVSKFRYQRGWKQDELVAKLQILGCNMSRDILANIETRRSPATDTQIQYFSMVFGVPIQDLFPARPSANGNGNGRVVGISVPMATRHRSSLPKAIA